MVPLAVVVIQVTVVSIDPPPDRRVSRKSLWRFLDPSGELVESVTTFVTSGLPTMQVRGLLITRSSRIRANGTSPLHPSAREQVSLTSHQRRANSTTNHGSESQVNSLPR